MRSLIAIVIAVTAISHADVAHVKYVDELVDTDHGTSLRVRGTVEGRLAVTRDGEDRVTLFGVAHNGKRIQALALGALPDRFRLGVDVALDGRWLDAAAAHALFATHHLDEQGEVFDVTTISVKLP